MSLLDSIAAMNPVIIWAIAGVVLLIAEVLMATSFIIPFSVAAFIVAVLTWLKLLPMGILWQGVVFALLGVLLIPVSRRLLQRFFEDKPDINRY